MPLYVALVLGRTSSVGLLEDDRGDGVGLYKVSRFQVRDLQGGLQVPIFNEFALQLLYIEYAILYFKHQPEQITV